MNGWGRPTVATESREPTLDDLFRSLDWSDFREDLKDGSRQALLDCAMYMRACASEECNWKGIRLDNGTLYASCPYCGGSLKSDQEARKVFQQRLGGVWNQVEKWMRLQGLVIEGLDK